MFIFFLLGGGEGESQAPGREGVCGGFFGGRGGGAKYFFFGAEIPTKF